VAHSRHILTDVGGAVAVQQDLRKPHDILTDPQVRAVLDLDQPFAVLLVAVMHAVPDEDRPAAILDQYRDAMVPGSYLAMAHGTNESRPEESARLVEISKRTTTPLTPRSRDEVARLFTGFDLVEPGLVWAPLWRPDSEHQVPERPELSGNLAGVGRRR
jgi:hypothetical protein